MNERKQTLGARFGRWSRRAGLTLAVLVGLSVAFCGWRLNKIGSLLGQEVADLDRKGAAQPGTDLGCRLWDVKHRRQPPRPKEQPPAGPEAPGGPPP